MSQGPYLMGLLHPAHISRGQWAKEPAQLRYLRRAVAVSKAYAHPPELIDTSTPPPNAITQPTLDDLHPFEAGIDEKGVAVDIEDPSDLLMGIGFCRLSDFTSIYIPFRHLAGALYWPSHTQFTRAVDWCDYILGSPGIPLIFHNGPSHDIPNLLIRGFHITNVAFDTMLAAHVAYPEMPKGLQFQATFHLGIPVWKHLVKPDEDAAEGKM